MNSNDKNSKNHVSDESLLDLGVTRDLWESWYEVMDNLYVVGQHLYPGEIKNIENDLTIGDLVISGSFSNEEFIEVSVSKDDIDYLLIRYNENIPTVVSAVYAVVQDHMGPGKDFNPESVLDIENLPI